MRLSRLLERVTVQKMFQTLYGQMVVTHDVEVRSIQYDSRKVEDGDLFVAIRGSRSDGRKYIAHAVENGAVVVVIDDDSAMSDAYFMHEGVVKVVVPNTRTALAQLSMRYYDFPSEKLRLVGVTGTNGKTTTTHLLRSVFESSGSKTGLIGTISYIIGEEITPATHTTPESLELNQALSRMLDAGCNSVVMEVSSHALEQHRVDGLRFEIGVFTNLTHDHLDYHRNMEEYFRAKKLLFDSLPKESWAVINLDDPWATRIATGTEAHTISYGIEANADIQANRISATLSGLSFIIRHGGEDDRIESPLIGRFNVYNILATFGTALALGIPKAKIVDSIRTAGPVTGRFEPISSTIGWTAIIDYAHTPDALEKALLAARDLADNKLGGRIITVFGCGGDRDRLKRPLMGTIAAKHSDIVIVTSDNPRHEDPQIIIDEVMSGIPNGAHALREPDRANAISLALSRANRGDLIIIAGKGHENYQVVGDEKRNFSDREQVEDFLRRHK